MTPPIDYEEMSERTGLEVERVEEIYEETSNTKIKQRNNLIMAGLKKELEDHKETLKDHKEASNSSNWVIIGLTAVLIGISLQSLDAIKLNWSTFLITIGLICSFVATIKPYFR